MEGEVPSEQDGFCRSIYRFIHQVAIGSNFSHHSIPSFIAQAHLLPRIVSKILVCFFLPLFPLVLGVGNFVNNII